jgi:hypothetical protein
MAGNRGARAGYGGCAALRMEEWWGEARAVRGQRRLVRMGLGAGAARRLRRDWGAPHGCGQRETNDQTVQINAEQRSRLTEGRTDGRQATLTFLISSIDLKVYLSDGY